MYDIYPSRLWPFARGRIAVSLRVLSESVAQYRPGRGPEDDVHTDYLLRFRQSGEIHDA